MNYVDCSVSMFIFRDHVALVPQLDHDVLVYIHFYKILWYFEIFTITNPIKVTDLLLGLGRPRVPVLWVYLFFYSTLTFWEVILMFEMSMLTNSQDAICRHCFLIISIQLAKWKTDNSLCTRYVINGKTHSIVSRNGLYRYMTVK